MFMQKLPILGLFFHFQFVFSNKQHNLPANKGEIANIWYGDSNCWKMEPNKEELPI